MQRINRRDFIKTGLTAAAGALLLPGAIAADSRPDLVVVSNGEPAELVRQAVEALGGIGRFVRPGQTVLIKPNIGWDRVPEQAANTNPDAVAQMVRMCVEAGAKTVRVLDRTCNQARRCYQRSGIEEAAKKAGAQVRHIIESRFQDIDIPGGELVKSWPVYRDVLESEVIINMPIAKHHSISGVTLGFKNFLGVLGSDRGALHRDFATKIVDINSALRSTLTIVDGYRVLLRNGPTGGNLQDVAVKKTVVAGTEPVAVDARAAGLLEVDWRDVDYLRIAEQRGLGKCLLEPARVKTIQLG